MDNLSVSDEYYDKKYEDIQVRLDKLYDKIEEIETFIEAVETSLYNIKQEKISGDNVYQFLLFFDNLYDRFTDMEKKIFMKRFLEEGNIYEAEQEDGRILRSLKFRFPVFFNEQELYELDWDNESINFLYTISIQAHLEYLPYDFCLRLVDHKAAVFGITV